MGVAGDFFHGNETEVQKFKPDCVIVCYHHIVNDRPSYIKYINTYINFWFYRSVDVPWCSSIFWGNLCYWQFGVLLLFAPCCFYIL